MEEWMFNPPEGTNQNRKPMKEIELRDVIHLYFGCEVQLTDGGDRYKSKIDGVIIDTLHAYTKVQPILRSLDSMTVVEARDLFVNQDKIHQTTEWTEIKMEKNKPSKFGESGWSVRAKYRTQNGNTPSMSGTMSLTKLTVQQFSILLSEGFDLFGLIDKGLAIKKEPS